MKNSKTVRQLVLPMVLLLAFTGAGCSRGHDDRVQDNGPDQLPMRMQLPRDKSVEALRIVQYAQDNVTRKVQQSMLQQGPYSGGVQLRLYDDNNALAEIRTFYAADAGAPAQLGYRATFARGQYLSEVSFSSDGVRQTQGQRLPDGTFEQNTYYAGGQFVYKHAILGRQMSDQQKLEWKPFADEIYRQDKSLAVVAQRMDDGRTAVSYYDEHNFLTETVSIDASGTTTSETDYRPDGKTPLVRYDFADKAVWTFDEKGQLLYKCLWYADQSRRLTAYQNNTPIYTQDWEVDASKSDKTKSPAKTVLYLSWVQELRSDGSEVRQINYFTGTRTVQTIEVPEAPAKDAKLKPAEGLSSLGSTTPVKNWAPPTASDKAAAAAKAAANAALAKAFWTPSGAHEVFTYSKSGNLVLVETYKAGSWTADKSVAHKESEHIRAVPVDAALLKPLPPGTPPPDKAKDPTPAMPSPAFSFDFD